MADKVLFIYPKFPVYLKSSIPVSFLHLGTFLRSKGYSVVLIDCIMEPDYMDLIAREAGDCLCIGISCMTSQIPHARDLCLYIRDELKIKVPIVFGGVHPTLYPEQTIQEPYIDYIVMGEGEISFLKLLEYLDSGENIGIHEIKGICYPDKDNNPVINSLGYEFDFREMPDIDYTLLNRNTIELYKKKDFYFPLLTSRGCPYRCAFCINVVTENVKWRALSAEKTVYEIKRINAMGFEKIWFWDENFFTSKKRLVRILELLESDKEIRLDAWAEGRANYFRPSFLSNEILQRMKRNGFNRMGIGFESGSQRVLDYLQKDITVEQIKTAALECSKVKLRISASFMIGIPTETRDDIRKTVEIIGFISSACTLFGISGPILYRPYPGSNIYKDCLKSGWKEPKNFYEWSTYIIYEWSHVPDPHRYPWIKDPYAVNLVHFFTYTLIVSFRNLISMLKDYCTMTNKSKTFFYIASFGLVFVSVLGKIRYKLGCYRFLIEKKIFVGRNHPNKDY
ncbi:B12-binding domain-containing radical SAM protein [Spirochaetota bacterium]